MDCITYLVFYSRLQLSLFLSLVLSLSRSIFLQSLFFISLFLSLSPLFLSLSNEHHPLILTFPTISFFSHPPSLPICYSPHVTLLSSLQQLESRGISFTVFSSNVPHHHHHPPPRPIITSP